VSHILPPQTNPKKVLHQSNSTSASKFTTSLEAPSRLSQPPLIYENGVARRISRSRKWIFWWTRPRWLWRVWRFAPAHRNFDGDANDLQVVVAINNPTVLRLRYLVYELAGISKKKKSWSDACYRNGFLHACLRRRNRLRIRQP
jgi:hypothetical protein